ncbi:hypothetical protein CVIRNUC_003791 [Coccomyxa viridis]|uniref:3-oxoacyl-[acyl-carrier-protein] reductase n=1 Tax=Coccomyxa viridis TaxID=1274662 RepID=A0AAV1HZN2_9CHLO|nr:hypothetical protein CVIRNUC_003791 [Coccomyxa viridis]
MRTSHHVFPTVIPKQCSRKAGTFRVMAQEDGKIAVVTGGTRGIGYAIVRSLARSGYKGFVLGYNSDHEAAKRAQAELAEEFGVRSVCVQGDVADAAIVRQLFQAVQESFDNRCTAFVHNAGLILGFSSKSLYEKAPVVDERTQQQLLAVSTNPDVTPSDTELDDMEERFEYYWRVYTLAFQLGMKLAVRCEGFQHIIAISAPGCNITYSPFIWLDDRGQGKAGMEYLVRVAARLYAKKGVNCNAIIPGLVLAGGTLDSIKKSKTLKTATDDRANNTTGRLMPPGEIGDVVSFLCSPQGLAITGVALPVDNGLHLFGR